MKAKPYEWIEMEVDDKVKELQIVPLSWPYYHLVYNLDINIKELWNKLYNWTIRIDIKEWKFNWLQVINNRI